VGNPLAQAILAGEFAPGDTIQGALIDGGLVFSRS